MIIVHYGEIGLKGKNRRMFEETLMKNIRKILGNDIKNVYREYGRIILEGREGANYKKIKKGLEKLPGIKNFSFAVSSALDMEDIKSKALQIVEGEEFSSFKVSAKRADKKFPFSSMQINEMVGKEIKEKLKKKVDLEKPDLTIFIEVASKSAYIYTKKYAGIGGLPVGSQRKVISLLSGGIDSPVASYLMMKRGCKVIFLHFYNENIVSYPEKVEEIVKKLAEYQGETKLYLIPFGEVQAEIIKFIPSRYRMILYRRLMTKIGEEIAIKEKAKAIVTGDSIGQVASQTLENLQCIYEASSLPIFSPLIGMNKEEIIEMAKRLETYEASIKPMQDCCSFMIAKHPVTKAKLDKVKEMEKRIDEKLIIKMIEKAECKVFR